jgi:alpha-glucosidase
LGLPDAQLADADRQDPSFFRSKGMTLGRDGARVPMPWNGDRAPFGFSSTNPWLPMPQEWSEFTVAAQDANHSSTLNLYRNALNIRRSKLVGTGEIEWVDRGQDGLISFARGEFAIYLNTSSQVIQIASAGTLTLGSDAEVTLNEGLLSLPPASAAWVAIR